jgi:saccharopine dehydrogenase-like NADP-dependent oxidoreductase
VEVKVAILGAGLVGGPMAIDLARDREFDVAVADIDEHALNRLSANMKEKTLRYQGHIEKMSVMRATGLFSQDPIETNGVQIRPLDFTAKLLSPKWKLKPGEADPTVMQVSVEGETDTHSMARTTGYTATVAIHMLAAGM